MSKVLVVSDNQLLSQLYTTNLEVYLAAQVINVSSKAEALEVIQGDSLDLIISLDTVKGIEVVGHIILGLTLKKVDTPIIVVGKFEDPENRTVQVSSSYSIQNIIRSAAKILNITAKTMASLSVAKYYPIEIEYCLALKHTPCPIYLELKKKNDEIDYVLIANKEHEVDEIVKKLKSEGVKKLYVSSSDRLIFIEKISLELCRLIQESEDLTTGEKSERLSSGFDFVSSNFLSEEVSSEVVGLASQCARVMDEVVSDSPDLKSLLKLFLGQKNGFIYTHSMLSAYVASHIVRNVPWGGESHIEKINFVLFFHDIHLAPIYQKYPHFKTEEDLLFSNELTNKEKDIVLNHAKSSAEMVAKLKKCPMGADLLIKQHHGMSNGVGFAMEYKDDISPLSKIIIISEAFVDEFLKKKENDPLSELDIGEIIETLNEKFKKHTYKKIIETLIKIKI